MPCRIQLLLGGSFISTFIHPSRFLIVFTPAPGGCVISPNPAGGAKNTMSHVPRRLSWFPSK
jgi:hypothetical protein